jgi:hypothetical protein
MLASLMRLMHFKPFRSKVPGPEEILAMEVANFLRAATLDGRLLGVWTSISNEVGFISGKHRNSGHAQMKYAKAIAMGMIVGAPDYVFVWPGGGGFIELKSKTGSLSPAQKDFASWCVANGVNHAVSKSLDQVRSHLISWGALRDP